MILTSTLRDLSSQGNLEPQLILRIDGIPYLFGAIGVEEILRFDNGYLFDDGLFFDSNVVAPNSKDVIQISGTTNNLTQQVNIDRGGANTIQRMTVKMIDEYQEITEILSNGNYVPEILGREAEIFISFKGASFPEDAMRIIKGLIDDIAFGTGSLTIGIAQADKYKSQEIFNIFTTVLDDNINNAVTTIPLAELDGFFLSQDALITYIKIDDELMSIEAINTNSIDVIRGALGTDTDEHDIDADVNAVYKLDGNAIDLALKLMLSTHEDMPLRGEVSFVQITPEINFNNGVFIPYDIRQFRGVVEGDTLIVASGANTGEYEILSIVNLEDGVYCLVDSDFVPENAIDVLAVRSKYNTLPIGLGMTPDDVDVVSHEQIKDFFGANLASMSFLIEEEFDAKDFIESQLYRPLGLYGVVRFGRSAVKFTAPAISSENTIILSDENVVNVESLKATRSINKYYYNTIQYKYGKSFTSGKYLTTDITTNEESAQLFKAGTKQLKIESDGYRRSSEVRAIIQQQSNRFLGRYAFAPRYIDGVKVLFADGFNLEVGDTVIVNGQSLKIKDIKNPGEFMPQSIFEIVNKSMNFFTGDIKLDLLETNFGLDSRFAVFGPSSRVANVTDNLVQISPSFLSSEFEFETDKWIDFIGEKVRIYNDDYSVDLIATITGISASLPNTLVLDGNYAIDDTCFIDLADYPEVSDAVKTRFTYLSASEFIWDYVAPNAREVLDVSGFFVGQRVELFNQNYDNNKFLETTITDIIGNVLYFEDEIDIILPEVEFINALQFNDSGNIYRFF
jgi:hypothetical protein